MKVKRLTENAILPKCADNGSAGYDLFASQTYTIPPWSRMLVKTDIALEIYPTHYGRIAPRSSLSLKGIDIGAGVIDSSYRGEIRVLLINSKQTAHTVTQGDRIAQIVFEQCFHFDFDETDELGLSERGTGGFGSTGK